MHSNSATSAAANPAAKSLDAELVKSRIRARLWGKAATVRLDRFELVRQLGRGSEGLVYEARDLESGALVALKQLHPAYSAAGGSLKREFRALADLVHPNLVKLHELFHVGAQCFYTMALVPGVDLVTYVCADGPRCHERLRATLPQLFAGLEALHAAGKLHRDLKPGNVLVRDDGRLVILDYGLVYDEHGDELLAGEPAACTPAYAAPEQLHGRPVAASDLYAVGALLYLALTDRLPFERSVAARRDRTAGEHAALAPPRALMPHVPADLETLCMALLAYDPAARPNARAARAFCAGDRAALRQPAPIAATSSACLVERGPLLRALHAVADARGTKPLALLLHGEGSVGKTALLRRFCAERAARGALVLHGRCYEREHVPYKALDAIIERLVRHLAAEPHVLLSATACDALARSFPVFGRLVHRRAGHAAWTEPSDDGDVHAQATAALKALLRELARAHELVLAVDDLHWGDLDSMMLIQYLLAEDEAPAILFVGVTRTDALEKSAVVRGLRGAGQRTHRCVEHVVSPLSHDDAARRSSERTLVEAPDVTVRRTECRDAVRSR